MTDPHEVKCFHCNKYKPGRMARFSLPGFGLVWACNDFAVLIKQELMNKEEGKEQNDD